MSGQMILIVKTTKFFVDTHLRTMAAGSLEPKEAVCDASCQFASLFPGLSAFCFLFPKQVEWMLDRGKNRCLQSLQNSRSSPKGRLG